MERGANSGFGTPRAAQQGMFEIRIHGRGGQGVVTAAEVLSLAAFEEGRHAQAFPSFGSERMGAPVVAFCRMDDKAIRLREPVVNPNALIIQDITLLSLPGLFDGLRPEGFVLINSARRVDELGCSAVLARHPAVRCETVPATELALQHLGRPLPNAALLGALAALTGVLKFESVAAGIEHKFAGKVGERNVMAARAAYHRIVEAMAREMTHAEAD